MNDANRTQMSSPPVADPNRTLMGSAPTVEATVTIKPVQCPVCKTFNPAGVMFCVDCGLIFDRAIPDDAFGAPAVQLPMLVDSTGREQPVRPGTNILGREGDILVTDTRASRRHAKIENADGVLTLEDLGSTNGTKVNGAALAAGERRVLEPADKVSLGGYELQLRMPGASGGNTTQVFAGNQTAAMPAPPRVETAPAFLVGEGKEYPLKHGLNTLGRKPENDICIPDPYVSGKHGTIELDGNIVTLTDIGSTNGTMLNDAKLVPNMPTVMQPDDVIRLGSMRFFVRLEERD